MAPKPGMTTCPPCVWPDSTAETLSAAASVSRRGSCASRSDRILGAPHHAGDIGRTTGPEADAGEIDPIAANLEASTRVAQHLNVLSRERRRHVAIVVVVAEDRVDAVRRVQRRQQLRDGTDEGTIAECDVVAAEHDQIGRPGIYQLHRLDDVLARHQRAVMNVGEKADSNAVERRGQAPHGEGRFSHADAVALVARRRSVPAPVSAPIVVASAPLSAARREIGMALVYGLPSYSLRCPTQPCLPLEDPHTAGREGSSKFAIVAADGPLRRVGVARPRL